MKTIMHFEHLTLNTGHSYISPSWQCSAQTIELAMPLLGGVMVPIPSDEATPLFLTETGDDKGAVATLYIKSGDTTVPLVEWWTVWDEGESATVWNYVKEAKDDFTRCCQNTAILKQTWEASFIVNSVNRPKLVPWSTVILLPFMYYFPAVTMMLGDIERVIVWAQLKRAGFHIQNSKPTGEPLWN